MRLLVVILLIAGMGSGFGANEVLSRAPGDRIDARVEGFTGKGGVGVLELRVGKEKVWDYALGYGYPVSSSVSWSRWGGMVAISVRTTKWSSEVKVIDVRQGGKELKIPDLRVLVKALNSGVEGRYRNVRPVGWVGTETLILECSGNLVEGGSDGMDKVNYHYLVTVHLPSQRVVSVVTRSRHDLNAAK